MKLKSLENNYCDHHYLEHSSLRVVANVAKSLNQPSYIVGGYVRDMLLNRPSKDIDFVTIGNGIELTNKVANELKIDQVTVFKNFGTGMIKVKGLELQFVGARKESYRTNSRKPIVENGTLEDDQNRRDFTINALAISLNEENYGDLLDPFNGMEDLQNKILRTPLDPDVTFTDDPLRMMRAARFAAQLNFNIEPKTLVSMKKNAERISIVSQERITDELQKIVQSNFPSNGFKILDQTGLLKIIFPEFAQLKGVEIRNGKAHKDNFYHTLNVLENILPYSEKNIWLRWAAILHDIAKPPTKRFHPKNGWTFHGHEDKGARMVPGIFKKLKLPLDQKMKYVQKLVQLHLRPIALTKDEITDSGIRRLLFDAGEDIEDLMKLCRADITSKNKNKVEKYLKRFDKVEFKLKDLEDRDRIRTWQPPISGEMIMKIFKIKPSKNVGILKDAIKDAILDGKIANNYDDAYEFLLLKAAEIGLKPTNEK